MKQNIPDIYQCSNLYTAAYLLQSGFKLNQTVSTQPGWTYFHFKDPNKQCRSFVKEFETDCHLQFYLKSLKYLKRKLQ